MRSVWSLGLVVLLLAACSSAPKPRTAGTSNKPSPHVRTDTSPSPRVRRQADAVGSEAAHSFLLAALQYKGKPYRFGGSDPGQGFDCSGLVVYVAKDALGKALPRSSRDLAAQGQEVDGSRLAVGDLVFFNTLGAPNSHVGIYNSHVGIYAGGGRFLHAPNSNSAIRLENMDVAYWQNRFTQARRLF